MESDEGMSDEELAARLTKDRVDRLRGRVRVAGVLEEVGRHYQERGLAELTLRRDSDVHAFYRLKADPSRVLYVQAYGNSDEKMGVTIVMQDFDPEFTLRDPGDGRPVESVPYDAKALEKLIEKGYPQLRLE